MMSCDCPCYVLDGRGWQRELEAMKESIVFMDEGNFYMTTKEFADAVQASDNYFVFATRERLPLLPYSIEDIYGLRKARQSQDAKKTYHEFYHLYA